MNLQKVAIRKGAVFIKTAKAQSETTEQLTTQTFNLLKHINQLGFSFSENALQEVNKLNIADQLKIFETLKEITGIQLNWTPMVKDWNRPINTSMADYILTYLANLFNLKKGSKLTCGCFIPEGTFEIERFNGCPFCGTAIETFEGVITGNSSHLKVLKIITEEELKALYHELLKSKVPLDSGQIEDLKILIDHYNIDENLIAEVEMKETKILLANILFNSNRLELAKLLINDMEDLLRLLWFQKTRRLKIVRPKALIEQSMKNGRHLYLPSAQVSAKEYEMKSMLKLKYDRKTCAIHSNWINDLAKDYKKQCEIMHPNRSMWVRIIRALRLSEYAKRKGNENLGKLLHAFYHRNYDVWNGQLNTYKLKNQKEEYFNHLKQKPGTFARNLFASMLWFDADYCIEQFKKVADKVSLRLIVSLAMYADYYFSKNVKRSVRLKSGNTKTIAANKLLDFYFDEQLEEMADKVKTLCLDIYKLKFTKEVKSGEQMFIHPSLYNIPLSVGDRNEELQQLPSALMGTEFPVKGDTVRLFMAWGKGLPAQRLDMDLSCSIIYKDKTDRCSYSRLNTLGCKHSGDVINIPHMVGTAEYIDIDIQKLNEAEYVVFTCNAYSIGSLAENMFVGWMDSKYPMTINKHGVGYNPAHVSQSIQIKSNLRKGLVFGVLDIKRKVIIWLEMPFQGQVVQQLNLTGVKALLNKLNSKLKLGNLLELKAEAQNILLTDKSEDADLVYNEEWALNREAINNYFLS